MIRRCHRVLGLLLLGLLAPPPVAGCGAPELPDPPDVPSQLSPEARDAYIAEDLEALRVAVRGRLLPPGYRQALGYSRLNQGGECRREELGALIQDLPTWIAYLERADCLAEIAREREAIEHFVQAVDLADSPEAIDYIVRRVCRAADQSGLERLAEMCVGFVE